MKLFYMMWNFTLCCFMPFIYSFLLLTKISKIQWDFPWQQVFDEIEDNEAFRRFFLQILHISFLFDKKLNVRKFIKKETKTW